MRVSLNCFVSLVICLGFAGDAWSQSGAESGVVRATEQLERGEYQAAERTIRESLIGLVDERAEAYRILGLSLFYQDRQPEARAAFLTYLRAEPDAHLDPALVPPEAITLFEDVRARNLAEIESLRPKPKKKRYLLLNLVPGAGQFQNGDRGKGIVIAAGMGTLLAANIGSYYWLRSNCDNETRVCGDVDGDDARTARNFQTVNLLSGVGAIGLFAYSVVDGYLGYRAAETAENNPTPNYLGIGLLPTSNGLRMGWQANF